MTEKNKLVINDIKNYVDNYKKKKKELIELLLKTEDHAIRDTVALALADLKIEEALPSLIKVISHKKTINHRSTLVFACEGFNCSKYLNQFVNVVIKDNFHTAMNALEVIKNIQKTSIKNLSGIKKKVEAALLNETDRDKRGLLLALKRTLS